MKIDNQSIQMERGFELHDYNRVRPFSSFLPGIAGEYGKPMWVFYTNRGQCISSFGIRDRNAAMLEFQPADKAYALTSLYGFRTFLKLLVDGKFTLYEPFQTNSEEHITQRLLINPDEIQIEETNLALGLRTRIAYFTLPNEPISALVRQVTVENIASKQINVEVLDGLPQVVPYGLDENLLKQMSRTMQAFAEILHVENNLPFYKLKVVPSDKPEVQWINAGFFTFTLLKGKLAAVIVDPEQVFGSDSSLRTPLAFMENLSIDPLAGRRDTMTGCAFSKINLLLKAGESINWDSYFGQTENWKSAQEFCTRLLGYPQFADSKRAENRSLIFNLCSQFDLVAGPGQLAPYTRQSFLDNTLRGGLPVVVPGTLGKKVFHVFTRKHGDMERDYNFFDVAPNYFSQGNGNFRDVNQNRRSENYIFPEIDTANIETFFNLIQIDGNNPLVVQSEKFCVPLQKIESLQHGWSAENQTVWKKLLSQSFAPGELFHRLLEESRTIESAQAMFERILGLADLVQDANHGEGYWVDHWIYNLDLLDSYAGLYPDRLRHLLVERKDFVYFDNDHVVQPRATKYVLRNDGTVRQLNAVIKDINKARLITRRTGLRNWMRSENGCGSIYKTTLLAKLINLLAVKVSLLDPFGIGLEMETDKPGWCDALNGLPGLFGSSTHEAYSLRRGIAFVSRAVENYLESVDTLSVPKELADFVRAITLILMRADLTNFFPVWQQLSTVREAFREQVRMGIAGEEISLSKVELLKFLVLADSVLQQGLAKAVDSNGLPVSYFSHKAESYEILPSAESQKPDDEDAPEIVYVKVTRFTQKPISAFLEGAVHALRGTDNSINAASIYHAVRHSSLYDHKLGMYRVNCPLTEESFEIGRSRIFSPGWLENESIFLHMHYKFLLETLRSGLSRQFFDDLKRGLVAFQRPEVYGRSPLENSSFIASSRFPDEQVHGMGFVARLSGATAEWISMVLHMGLGAAPFRLVEDKLRFEPQPTLAEWLFTSVPEGDFKANSFGFKLFGQTWIVYENPNRRSTFGPDAVVPLRFDLYFKDGTKQTHSGKWLTESMALSLRECRLSKLVICLG